MIWLLNFWGFSFVSFLRMDSMLSIWLPKKAMWGWFRSCWEEALLWILPLRWFIFLRKQEMTYSLFAVYISKFTGISRFLTTKAPLNVAEFQLLHLKTANKRLKKPIHRFSRTLSSLFCFTKDSRLTHIIAHLEVQ